MGLTPEAGTEPTDSSITGSDRRLARLDIMLDVRGLVALAWMLLLWQLGTFRFPGEDLDNTSPFPRFSAFPGFAELSPRGEISLALVASSVLLAVVVLARLGRPSGWARAVAAAPLLILLLGVGIWRFVVGFVGIVGRHQQYGESGNAGLWDGYAIALGLAAVVLLVVRSAGPSRLRRVIVTGAVSAAVTASLVSAGNEFTWLFRANLQSIAFDGAAALLPPLIVALVGIAMAPGLLQRMHQGHLSAAAGVLTWGLVVLAGDVLPPALLVVVRYGRRLVETMSVVAPVDGLDWLEGALAVAAAALIAPVVRAYREQDRAGRLEILRGPLAVLAILLFARLIGDLVRYNLLMRSTDLRPGGYPIGMSIADQVIPLLGLLGAALVLRVALRPQRPSAPWTMLAGALLIAGPSIWYLTPAFHHRPFAEDPLDFGFATLPFLQWDGAMFMQSFVLPLILLFLLVTVRRGAPDPSEGPGPAG
jgi:hypothetical protein